MKQSDLPVYVFSRATYKGNNDGTYVFNGVAACTLSVGPGSGQAVAGLDQAGIRIIKNKSGTGNLTVTGTFWDTGMAAVAALVLTPGQAVTLAWDGTNWCVVGKAN